MTKLFLPKKKSFLVMILNRNIRWSVKTDLSWFNKIDKKMSLKTSQCYTILVRTILYNPTFSQQTVLMIWMDSGFFSKIPAKYCWWSESVAVVWVGVVAAGATAFTASSLVEIWTQTSVLSCSSSWSVSLEKQCCFLENIKRLMSRGYLPVCQWSLQFSLLH